MKASLYTDGACLGNPGPMGLGVCLRIGNNTYTHAEYAGQGTNNVAEYSALLKGLEIASTKGVTDVACFLDSELVVKQLTGVYRIKDARLQEIAKKIQAFKQRFVTCTITHIPREQNSVADTLSKQGAQNN